MRPVLLACDSLVIVVSATADAFVPYRFDIR